MFNNIEQIYINITTQCFSNCINCNQPDRNTKEALHPFFKVKNVLKAEYVFETLKLLKSIRKDSPLNLSITGGEPLLCYQEASKIIKFCRISKIHSTLVTDGFLIKKPKKFLKDFPANTFYFSIDGDKRKINDGIRRLKGHFKKIVWLIPKLKKEIIKKNLSASLISSTVLIKQNYERLKQMEVFFKSLGFDQCTFCPPSKPVYENCSSKKFSTLIIDDLGHLYPCWSWELYNLFPVDYKRFSLKKDSILNYSKYKEYWVIKDFLKNCKEENCIAHHDQNRNITR
jgi:sulfatase maturation enzyme AslB (radical SAM superfamily)